MIRKQKPQITSGFSLNVFELEVCDGTLQCNKEFVP